MKLIVISYPDELENEVELINTLFENGLEHFHLRKPDWSSEQVEKFMMQINSVNYSRMVLHDHFELAKKYQLGGIHFTHRTTQNLDEWIKYDGTKSISCHNLNDLQNLPAGIDYAFLSPVFPSISKPGYSGKLGLELICQFLKSNRKSKVVALGGIDEEKLMICKKCGFDGIAVLGRIWDEELSPNEINNRFSKIRNACLRTDHM